MQETWVQSLGQKDPLEKGIATHSSILTNSLLPHGLYPVRLLLDFFSQEYWSR